MAEGGVDPAKTPDTATTPDSAQTPGSALMELHAEVGRFYVRDRALLRAQKKFATVLAARGPLDAAAVRTYLDAVKRYFVGFEREAQLHLKDVEARLARVAQLQFNLTAERGVAARRVEATGGVLERLQKLAGR